MAEPVADPAAEHPGSADAPPERAPGRSAASGGYDLWAHRGPWTEAAYLALPAVGRSDGRVEVVDGTLLVGPAAGPRRRESVAAVRAAVRAALPDGLRVVGPVPVRLSQDCLLVPDLVVVGAADAARVEGAPGADATPAVLAADAVLMVIEVIDGEHGAVDRVFKPQLWARSQVPYVLLLDHDAPFAVANMLIGGRYHEYARAEGSVLLALEEPFRLQLRPDLAGAPAPSNGAPADRPDDPEPDDLDPDDLDSAALEPDGRSSGGPGSDGSAAPVPDASAAATSGAGPAGSSGVRPR